jgi:hypothetical protein
MGKTTQVVAAAAFSRNIQVRAEPAEAVLE